jgi:predicted permease
MAWLTEFGRRLAFFLRRRRFDRELDEEMRDHLALKAQTHIQNGLPPDEARYAAAREFGNTLLLREESSDLWAFRWIEEFVRDLRYGLRMLAGSPGFTAVAVLTLALGIGVNTTIFSLLSSMLLRKPPVNDPDRLMMLVSRNSGGASPLDGANRLPASPPDFLDWRAQATSFSGMAADSEDGFTLTGGTEPERVPGAQVSANYFQVLGVAPVVGRDFLAGEDQAEHSRVVVLREDLWKRRFGADPQVIGRAVKVNGDTYTVIGIMPDSFRRMWLFPAQVWMPLVFSPGQLAPAARQSHFLNVFARLKPRVTEASARAELVTIAGRVAAANPETEKGWSASVMTVQKYAIEESNSSEALTFLMAAVGFVLLIACANLANLLLARNSNRGREFAIRSALGAGGFRLMRQLLAECFVLSIAGGALGLLFTVWGLRFLRAALNWNNYAVLTAEQLSIDGQVLVFTLAVSVATALIFGVAPAAQMARRDPNVGLKEGSRSATAGRQHHRLQNLLVMSELALSLVLLVGAGLFVGSFVEELHASRAMDPRGVLTASVSLSGPAYKEPERQVAFFQNALRRLSGFPEVQSAAVSSDLPFTFPSDAHFAIEGRPAPKPEKQSLAGYFTVSPGYFAAMQIPLREGREFTPADTADSAPVVIVNQAFARQFFPNQDPLGQHIRAVPEDPSVTPGPEGSPPPRWSEIVGVASDVDEVLWQPLSRPHIFEPFLQRPGSSMDLVVRLKTNPGAFAASLRRTVWSIDKDQPVTDVKTMDRVVRDAGQGSDLMAALMGAFAAIAVVMAAVGIYGLIAYLVGRRTHELGVRMALGARQREVLMLVLGSSMRMVVAGVGIGFLISLGMPRLVAASFPGFGLHGGWILAGTPLAVILVAFASCYVPARRASKVDPMAALRCE